MYARPTPAETDEDLLAQQEEFLKNITKKVINPAAKLANPSRPYVKPEPENDVEQMETVPNTNIVPNIVMGSIIEKKIGEVSSRSASHVSKTGFPHAQRRSSQFTKKKGASIFAQQISQKKPSPVDMEVDITEPVSLPTRSNIVSGREGKEIHEENMKLLNEMSPQDILKQRQELLMQMDPKIVQFIASKRAKVANTPPIEEPKVLREKKVIPNDLAQEIPVVSEIISNPSSEKWLHFDKLEAEKFEWMKNIPEMQKMKKDGYEARFDFEGWLQPFSMQELPLDDKTRVLYQHGDEPQRPGYTIQELLHLSRSTVSQQRILALNTLANILALYHTGIYDDIFEIPLEQIFFVVRIACDENSDPVLVASMRALRNIFYYEVDEMCLETVVSFNCDLVQPILEYNVPDGTNKEAELNDQQLAESNLIKCLLRTDILIRIKYVISVLKASPEVLFSCVGLLTRMVRDIPEIADQVIGFIEQLMPTLMDSIFQQDFRIFEITPNMMDVKVLVATLKLLRISIIRNVEFAQNLIKNFDFYKILLFYLSNDAISTDFVKLQTQAFLLVATFVQIGGIDCLTDLQFMISKHLMYHLQNTNLSEASSFSKLSHASSVITLIVACFTKHPALVLEPVKQMLDAALIKWYTQLANMNSCKCGHLQVVATMAKCWSTIKWRTANPKLLSLFSNSSFSSITNCMKSSSNLLCPHKPHETKSAIDSVQASIWDSPDHIVPVLNAKSPFPFLASFSECLLDISDPSDKLTFIRHSNIKTYLNKIYESNLKLISNWFTHRIETKFIFKYLLICISVRQQISEEEKYAIYLLTLKIVHIFNEDDPVGKLISDIIFNLDFIPSTNLMEKLQLESSIFAKSFEEINEIREYYLKLFCKNSVRFMAIPNRNNGFLPSDWFYFPIIVGYSTQKMDLTTIKRCLQCVCLFESLIPEISSIIHITERYCRLACAFLCDNALFLDPDIHLLLEACFTNILKTKQKFNFDKNIKGLNNFEEFYVSLLEQYQAISYGDILFGNVILLPLTQQHNVKWKKIIWSEYAGAVQIINLRTEQVMIPIQDFLEPAEKDMSLLKCYNRALKFGHLRRSEFLTKVCSYHLEQFNKRKSST